MSGGEFRIEKGRIVGASIHGTRSDGSRVDREHLFDAPVAEGDQVFFTFHDEQPDEVVVMNEDGVGVYEPTATLDRS